MESGFTINQNIDTSQHWEPISHHGSGRFEFFKVRLFGALHFVKRPAPPYIHDLRTTESLKKEFAIGYNLNHPSLPKYIKMEDGAVYEEYIDGHSLRQMIEQDDDRLKSPHFLKNLCQQLLEATEYIHIHGVVHNDIKPDNVMITRIGDQVKLVDFGCALTDMWDSTPGYTPEFKAPEQGSTPKTNIHADIYLVGKLVELLATRAGERDHWAHFIRRATATSPDDRFPSDKTAIFAIPKIKKRESKIFGIMVTILFLIALIVGAANLISDAWQWATWLWEKVAR